MCIGFADGTEKVGPGLKLQLCECLVVIGGDGRGDPVRGMLIGISQARKRRAFEEACWVVSTSHSKLVLASSSSHCRIPCVSTGRENLLSGIFLVHS